MIGMHNVKRLFAATLALFLLLCVTGAAVAYDDTPPRRTVFWWTLGGAASGTLVFGAGSLLLYGFSEFLPTDTLLGTAVGGVTGAIVGVVRARASSQTDVLPQLLGNSAGVGSEAARQLTSALVQEWRLTTPVRIYVLDFVDSADQVTPNSRVLAEDLRVALVSNGPEVVVLEREMLDAATEETQYYNYVLAEEPTRLGEIGFFAPADVVVSGRLLYASNRTRLFVRAFRVTDGVVLFAESYYVRFESWRW